MMKAHCDRCEKLIDSYPAWCDEGMHEKNKIYHIYINVDSNGDAQQFCNSCMIIILELYLKAIR